MPFREEDRHLPVIKSLRVSKGYGASLLCRCFWKDTETLTV